MGIAIAPSDHTRVYLITGESFGNDKGFFVSNNGDRLPRGRRPDLRDERPRRREPALRVVVRPALRRPGEQGPPVQDGRQPPRVVATAARPGATPGTRTPTSTRMAWDPNVPNRVYLGDDGGMYRSDNNGTSLDPRHEHAVAPALPRRRLADAAEPDRHRPPGQRLEPQLVRAIERPWPTRSTANWSSYGGGDGHYVVDRPAGRHVLATRAARTPAAAASTTCRSRRRRCRRRPPSGATNVKLASVTGLVVGSTLTIDSTGRQPGDGDDHVRRHRRAPAAPASASPRRSPSRTPRARRCGRTACRARRTSASAPRGSGLRLHDRRAARARTRRRRRRSTSAATTCPGRRTAARTGRRSRRPTCSPGRRRPTTRPNNNPLYAGQYPSISTIAPSKSDPNTIYVGTDNGRLWRTTTSASTWQEFPNPFAPDPPRWVTSVIADPVDSTHAYASFGGFREGYTSANVFETTTRRRRRRHAR